jgi:glyoxylase-like metal-dependent hydrolase (beta-lactamase superfamily II)
MKNIYRWGVALIALACVCPRAEVRGQRPAETLEIAEGVWQISVGAYNSLAILTSEGWIVADPGSDVAALLIAVELERLEPSLPLMLILYSHHHADHAAGARVLQEKLNRATHIIGHINGIDRASVKSGAVRAPSIVFRDELVWRHGRRVELRWTGPSHTDDLITVYVPDVRVVLAVDFVAHDQVGYQDLRGWDLDGLFPAIENLLSIPFETVVFGHGPPGDRASVSRQKEYYSDLKNAVRHAIQRGWSESEAASNIRLPRYSDWAGYAEWLPLNVRAFYRWQLRDSD